ncbi:hypothetical protein FOFC_18781, partial [Fusarium oxysporum]
MSTDSLPLKDTQALLLGKANAEDKVADSFYKLRRLNETATNILFEQKKKKQKKKAPPIGSARDFPCRPCVTRATKSPGILAMPGAPPQRAAQQLRACSAAPAPALAPRGEADEKTLEERKVAALEAIAEAARLWTVVRCDPAAVAEPTLASQTKGITVLSPQASPVTDVSIRANVRTSVPMVVALKASVEKLRWLSTNGDRTKDDEPPLTPNTLQLPGRLVMSFLWTKRFRTARLRTPTLINQSMASLCHSNTPIDTAFLQMCLESLTAPHTRLLPIAAPIQTSPSIFSTTPASRPEVQERLCKYLLGKEPEYAQADSQQSMIQYQQHIQNLISQPPQPVTSQAQTIHQSLETLLGISSQRKSLKKQLDAASIKAESGRTTLADLPTVQIGCKRYIPEEYIANKNRKGRRSWIQAYGFCLTEVSPDLRTLQTYWACSKCDERGKSSLFVATNTTSPIEHLRSWFVSEECLAFEVLLKTKTMGLKEEFMLPVEEVLRLREGSRLQTLILNLNPEVEGEPSNIQQYDMRMSPAFIPFQRLTGYRSHMITEADGNAYEDSSRADSQPPSKRRCLELPTARSNVNKAKELTVGWIVTANLPFTAPSNPYLRRMLDLHDASLAKEVPWSRQSVRDTMRKLFEVKKGAISCQLEKAVTKISFSFDMWTSPNRRSQTRASPDDLPFELSSFDAIFRTTHPEKAKLGPSGKRKTSGRVMYECLHCPPDSPWSNGKRGNAIYHAKRKHASILQTEASTVDEHDSDIITRPSKQPRMDSFFPSRPSDTTLRRVFNRQQYIESIVGLLTRRRLPFSAVKWDEMQDIILACNPAIEDLLLTSRDAAMRHITTTFDLYRPQLKAKLQASVSKIHLSTDLWTSPHRHGILAVCVRWVDNGYRLQKALLAMPECRYSHSGERQATLMAEAIEEYGIAKQIGYHTGDNATSNDTCLKHLSQMLQDKYGISFHPNQRRIRCIAHIINLSLQAFLLASSKEALRAALAAASDVTGAEMYEQFYFTLYDVSANEPTSRSEASEQQEQSFSKVWKGKAKRAARKPPDFRDDKFRGWQTIPAMRKLHNIAVWLRNSSIHSDLWEDRVSLRLGIDNDTRWNSWYKLIDNLIRRQSQIKQFLLDYDKEINDNILNSSDWDYLERTYRFLHPFASATLWAEGKNSTLSQILTIMDGLLRHYEKNKEHYSKPETFDRRILHSIEMGWFILDKYYTMTEDAPVYAAALLLDPSKRIRYIERHWPESWHENAIAGVRTIWEEYKTQPETGPAESVDEVSASQKRQPNEWDALLEELEVTEDLGDSMDDLEDFKILRHPMHIRAVTVHGVASASGCGLGKRPPILLYLRIGPVLCPFLIFCIIGSPLQWWCHKDQRKTYPQLSRMAIDILSIAPESADPESAFSGGRRTLSWDRERMTCENLEKVECIGNWLREGHIQKTVHGGMGVITDTGFDSGGGEDSDSHFMVTRIRIEIMAIDILSIAPESADPECAFSGGRRTLSWDRERMTCENIEKVECIGNWLREGHIQKAVHSVCGGEDPDSFEREAFTEAAFQVEERELRLWRKRGAVGKLHNIV